MKMLHENQPDQTLKVPTLSPTVQVRRQVDWEHSLVQKGITRYRASLVKQTDDGGLKRRALVDTEPGLMIARDLIGPMITRIEEAQVETIKRMEDPNYKRLADSDWVLVTLSADRLAAVTVLRAMSYTDDVPFTQAAKAVGRAVRDEYDYDRWKQAESQAEKDRKGAPEYVPNMFKLMHQRNKEVDPRVFKKWASKSALFTKSDWEDHMLLSTGSWLLAQMIECNGWYEARQEWEAGKTKRVLGLTEIGKSFIQDRHASNELSRPYYLPMIEEPLDYKYVEQGSSPSIATAEVA